MEGRHSKIRYKNILVNTASEGCIQQRDADNTTTVPSGRHHDTVGLPVTCFHVDTISALWGFMPSPRVFMDPAAVACYEVYHGLDITMSHGSGGNVSDFRGKVLSLSLHGTSLGTEWPV